MKKIFFNLFITIVTLMSPALFVSCENGLEKEVYDQLSENNFPVTAADAEVMVNNIYYQFKIGTWNRYNAANESRLVMNLFATDEFTCYWDGYWDTAFNFTWLPDGWPYSTLYTDFMPSITQATVVMAQLRTMTSISQEEIDSYIAEVLCSRGYWIYDIYNHYGPVPMIIEEEDALDQSNYVPGARPSSETVVGWIESDLTYAAENLPATRPSTEYGRMTKGAALMGLLKLYMHEKDWENAKTAAQDIIDLGVYSLQSNYESIWAIENEGNSEIIFAIGCDAQISSSVNNYRAHVLPTDYASPLGLSVTAWNGYRLPWERYDSFDSDDKRRNTMVRYYYNSKDELIDAREADNSLGAIPLKYPEDPDGTGQNQGADYVIYRYADVLLSLAEALNEINGPNQESIDLINEVRERAFNTDKSISLLDYATTEALRDRILDERGWELTFEGSRREDLIRMGKFVEYANDPERMGNRNPQQNCTDTHLLLPLPYQAIYENPEMDNNDGY